MRNQFYLFRSIMVIMFFGLIVSVNAQKKHFVYIQAENKQPFYVMVNNKNFSSTVNGHLVIPKLRNGKYFFVAGFPKELYPEQKFSCIIADKDLGFVLKQYGSKGWGLFDLISFSTTMANAEDWEKDKVLNDTIKITEEEASVIKPTLQTIEPKKQEEVKPIEPVNNSSIKPSTNAEVIENNNTQVVEKQKKGSEVNNENNGKLSIVKMYQKGGSQGLDQVYIDYAANPSDTITIFIPFVSQTRQKGDTTNPQNSNTANQYNINCVNLATEIDYAKSRKLMSSQTTDDKMVNIAIKSFKNKCYTVEQIKTFGLLFLSEQSRYKFFISAKAYIYDIVNYSSLETQFTLPNIIEQFRKSVN